MLSCMNFLFCIDKKTLEFKVIDKNSKYDKLNLRSYNFDNDKKNLNEKLING